MTPGLEFSPLIRQMLLGACAGVAGTVAMTAVMRRLHERLPPSQRYPLPPRELTDRIVPRGLKSGDEDAREQWTTLAHFGYGAAVGACFPVVARGSGMVVGSLYGVCVWAVSYLGWVPAFGVLRPAIRHPWRRNSLMIASHLVWGGVLALTLRELRAAEREAFGEGPHRDADGSAS